MSITFSLPEEFTIVPHSIVTYCPGCGDSSTIGQGKDCETCFGYGGDTEAEVEHQARIAEIDGEFNVSNRNGYFILQDILNLHDPDAWGSISPVVVLMRLQAYFNPESGVMPTSIEQGVRLTPEGVGLGPTVYDFGRTLNQVESYVSRLQHLAEIAIDRGCNIEWS